MLARPQQPSEQGRWLGSNSRNYMLLSLLICFILVLMAHVYQSANRASVVHAPLVDAAMEIKLEATIGYLQLKEVLSGESQVPIDQVWAHYELADWYAKAMLEGGTNAEGSFRPLDDFELRKMIGEVRIMLARFADISRTWYQERLSSSAESPTNQVYHELFLNLVASADQVETALQKSIAGELRLFRLAQLAMLMTTLLLTTVAFRFLIRFERKKKTYLLELEEARNDLEVRVEERTATLMVLNQQLTREVKDRCAAEAALHKSEAALRHLLAGVMDAQDQERARVAGELTEGIGQTMVAANLVVSAVMGKVDVKSAPGIIDDLETILRFIETALKDLRGLGDDLHPTILDFCGTLETINWHCRNFQDVNPGIRISHESDLSENEIPQCLKIPIYRILQEILNNVANHSGAGSVEIRLARTGNEVKLTVKDNGCGIGKGKRTSPQHQVCQIGIRIMQERAKQSGGLFTIESPLGKGTLVCVIWELTNAKLAIANQTSNAD